MRIGLSGGAASVERLVKQATDAENDGFTTLWYASAIAGDPLVAMAAAGAATARIELGTAVLQTYTCHPVLQANRAAATVNAMGRPGLTLGVGPSHRPVVEDMLGLSYAHAGRHTEEYVQILTGLLKGEPVQFEGDDFRVNAQPPRCDHAVPVLVSALAPRLLRVARDVAEGTVLWMANARAVETHVVPHLGGGSRIVAGLPVAVHDDVGEAREVAARLFAGYGTLPNYRRILDIGGAPGPADAAIVGPEAEVEAEIRRLFDAGATDVWAAAFPVNDDTRGRTRALLKQLAQS